MSPESALAQQGSAEQSTAKPAHRYGWPMRSAGTYVGWSGARWGRDFGIASGRCNRQDITAIVLVPVGGGKVAPQVSSGYTRNVGTLRGGTVRALVGVTYGGDFDDRDRDCIGHALEIGKTGRSVSWLNPGTGLAIALTPGKESHSRQQPAGHKCRDYIITVGVAAGGARQSKPGVACSSEPGLWIIG
jgi:surface antigen